MRGWLPSRGRNRRGERVLRVGSDRGQAGAGDQLINVMLVIVVAAAIGFIGTDVNEEIEENTDRLDGETVTVTNESVGTVTFNANNNFFYTVSDNSSSRLQSFADDEAVFNTTSDTKLTEGTDYEWFPANGTVRIDNTSATGNNTADTVITYNWTERSTNFGDASNNLSGGYASAMGLTDVVFIVLMFGVILSVLLVFRMRS